VISNRAEAPGLQRARDMGLNAICIQSKGKDQDAYDSEIVTALQAAQVELVCLAGFMRILGPSFLRAYGNRTLNIHPSLLPAFPGREAQKQALQAGVKFTGCTVHLLEEGIDTGPIICQAAVPVFDDDTEATLSARILKEEHRIYSEAICLVLEDRIQIEGSRVKLKQD
jgi:phosphoribosylglycinamide formyltransferase-1